MSKKLFFILIVCILTSTLEKKTFAFSQDRDFPDSDHPGSLSFSLRKNKENKNVSYERGSQKTHKDFFHKFNSYERSIIDFVSTTEFNSEQQLHDADLNQVYNRYSSILEPLTPFKRKYQETQIDQLLSSQGQLQKESNNRILQSQFDLMYIGENVEGEFILENEETSFVEFENDETESPFEESGETEDSEGGANENGETNENNEGSWLDGEVCFEALSSAAEEVEEVSIVEGQQSRRLKFHTLDTHRLLSLIEIDVNINIEIEKIHLQEEEEQMEGKVFVAQTISAINPGGQSCQSERICRETIIPRIGKRCLCRQIVVCSF